MCSKEVIALSIINPIFDFDFKNSDGTQILDEIRLSVLSASEIVEFESFDEAIMFNNELITYRFLHEAVVEVMKYWDKTLYPK